MAVRQQDGEPKSRARKELDFGKEIYETFLDSLAEVLSLRVAAREAGRQIREAIEEQASPEGMRGYRLPRGSELRDLAFDLAQLQVQNLKAITALGRNHTDFIVRKLRERASADAGRSERARRREILVRPSLDPACKEFRGAFDVVNATSARGTLSFPGVLTFRRTDGAQTCVAEPKFTVPSPTLAAGAETTVKIAITLDSFSAGGRYLAQAPISLGAEHTLELFLQVDVERAGA